MKTRRWRKVGDVSAPMPVVGTGSRPEPIPPSPASQHHGVLAPPPPRLPRPKPLRRPKVPCRRPELAALGSLKEPPPCSTRDGPPSIVVVRLDNRRATGAPTRRAPLHHGGPPTRGKCRILPPPQRSVRHFPRFPGKMQNGMPSEHQVFYISPGFRAKCRILPRRPSSVLHFPRGGEKISRLHLRRVQGNARAGGRPPRNHHPRSFRYDP